MASKSSPSGSMEKVPESLPELLRSRPYPSAAERDLEDHLHVHEAERLIVLYG